MDVNVRLGTVAGCEATGLIKSTIVAGREGKHGDGHECASYISIGSNIWARKAKQGRANSMPKFA